MQLQAQPRADRAHLRHACSDATSHAVPLSLSFLPVLQRFVHDWPSCPFAHPGEKAKRRDPRTHVYDCEMCPAVTRGETCELGAACPHSHHVFESWLHPQKYRTLLCKDGDSCHREVCFFGESVELRGVTCWQAWPSACQCQQLFVDCNSLWAASTCGPGATRHRLEPCCCCQCFRTRADSVLLPASSLLLHS